MKIYSIAFFTILLNALAGCKKDKTNSQSPPPLPSEKRWVVTTVAGEGSPAFANGAPLSAKFHFPEDVVVARDGSIYVTDVFNTLVRKITGNQVSTFAGNTSGIENGIGALAKFKSPYSITMDAVGNFYSTDENDPRIRKISATAEVSTFAGTETEGFADGESNTARFYPGNSIAADANGNVYIADARNNRIRMATSSGRVSTIAGNGIPGYNNGNAETAQFGLPGGIALDNHGNLYIIDRGNYRVRKITPAGQVSTIAGNGTKGDRDGIASDAQFSDDTHDIIADGQGNIYVEDENRIRMITPQGIVYTIAGSTAGYADGDGVSAKFNYLAGMGIDPDGNLYVADLNNNRIRKISFE